MSFRICLIGCGSHSTFVHGPSLKMYAGIHADTVLAGCCDLNEQASATYRQRFGFMRHYTGIDQMLDREKADAVCLVLPPEITAEISIHVLQKGYPLILEKPPGRTKREAQLLADTAERSGLANQLAFNRRFMPLVQRMKALLKQEALVGKISHIQYEMARVGRTDPDFSTTAIHGIDLLRYIVGSPYRTVHFQYRSVPGYDSSVCNAYLFADFWGGASAQLSFTPLTGIAMERLTVHTAGSTFILDLPVLGALDQVGRLTQIIKNNVRIDMDGHSANQGETVFEIGGFYEENRSFFSDVRSGVKPIHTIRTGIQSVEIAQCIRDKTAFYESDEQEDE